MRYKNIRHSLRTGDIVLFRGKGRISRWIRWWCSLLRGLRATWASHVGVIILDQGRVMLLESTSIRGGFRGVRLVSLGDVLTEYNGDVRIRRLKHSLYPEVVEAKTSRFVQGVLGRPYEKNLLELMRAAWTFTRIKYETPNELFCSELVAGMYQLFGFIPKAPSANNYTPEDFRIGGVVDRMMRLSPEAACLGEEIDVKTGIE